MPESSTPPLSPLDLGPGVALGGDHGKLVFILGPCVIEGDKFLWRHARAVAETCRGLGAAFVFKASYDKANRTSADGFRGGLGAREGCELLVAVGREIGAPVTTDVHSPAEAEIAAAAGVDVLQIPAFLCRQTDLVQTAAATGKVVNVKKGQFLAPWDVAPIAEKIRAATAGAATGGGTGEDRFFFTERGTTFGYNNLVADLRSLPWMRAAGFRTVFDATHSVQRPGGGGGHTTGDGELAPVLARAAVAAGCDGVFLETHEDPTRAPSDGPNQIPLRHLPALLLTLQRIHEVLAVPA